MTGMLLTFGACTAGSTAYLLLRDEALHALGSRQAKVERSYEEHVASLRRELETVNSQRLLEGAAMDARVRELSVRQAQIESRAMMLAALATGGDAAAQVSKAPRTSPSAPTPAAAAPSAPPGALGFAPPPKAPGSPALDAFHKAVPRPDESGAARPASPSERPPLRGAFLPASDVAPPDAAGPAGNLASIVIALDRMEDMQVGLARAVGLRARREAARLETMAAELGLRPDRLLRAHPAGAAAGGPFVALNLDPNGSPFDRAVLRHQDDMLRADRLRRALSTAPLGRPVSVNAEQSSGFGSRIDPFLGRPAYHTGIDFREYPGAPVFATAPGTVSAAGSNGGYGLMVEIDHGNGITTRYAHLSAILVSEEQAVSVRQVIGRVGSTGRSTGPHLHYEVRIDDDPVDPARFVRAGERLAQISAQQSSPLPQPSGAPLD